MRAFFLATLGVMTPFAWTIALGSPTTTQEEKPLSLLDHQALQVAIQRLANEHPEIVTVLPIGTTRTGRKIDALRVMAGERTPGRPAILLVANIDGPRVFTSAIALEHARTLANAYGSNTAITKLLDTTTLYIVPRANPDAAAARFGSPLMEQAASGHGVDDDRDGRVGEDAPGDLNKDGHITWMRCPDPEGTWIEDPADPRALIEADAERGERGKWKLYPEGDDTDGDERVAEDPELDAIVNRNFPARWEEHTPAAGLYSTDEPETRALIDFVLSHKDIALVLTYGEQDNLVETPKSIPDDASTSKRIPKRGVYESDVTQLKAFGESYRELTGAKAKGSGEDSGSFQLWCYEHRGITSLRCALWSIPLDSKDDDEEDEEDEEGESEDEAEESESKKDSDRKPTDDAKRFMWIDQQTDEVVRHVAWEAYEHPTLGMVDIGGFTAYATIEPPADELRTIADKHLKFLITLGEKLPRLEIVECTAQDLGGGLLRVEAAIENPSTLPLMTRAARRTRSVRPARVRLNLPAGAQLLAGQRNELIYDLDGVGGRTEYTWLISGAKASSIALTLDSDSAGAAVRQPEIVQ